MKMLEIDDKEFINLNKVIRVKIKDNRLVGQKVTGNPDTPPEVMEDGFKLEFELDNNIFVTSKNFETVEEARMWLFEHTKKD